MVYSADTLKPSFMHRMAQRYTDEALEKMANAKTLIPPGAQL